MVKTEKDSEKRILEAAKKVFHKKGFDGARMQEIADQAGINKALLHYYFRSKDNLFNAVFREALQEIFSRMISIAGKDVSFQEKIQQIFHDYISFLQDHSYIPGFILAEIRQNPDKIKKLFRSANLAPSRLFEIMKESVKDDAMEGMDYKTFLINILSLCIFPFAAEPLLKVIFDFSEPEFKTFIERRKTELPLFFMNAIRKK
jgi:TetR/AcrR family transcriptional regulator